MDGDSTRDKRTAVEEDASTVRVSSVLSGIGGDTIDDSNIAESSTPNLHQPIYISSGDESWELTWPIFHMLPRSERKAIALQQGFEHIGDFEESMILSRALALNNSNHTSDNMVNEEGISSSTHEHPNNGSMHEVQLRSDALSTSTESQSGYLETKPSAMMIRDEENSDIDDDDDEDVNPSTSTVDASKDAIDEEVSYNQEGEEDISNGGHMMQLPEDLIINHIFSYIGIEHFYYCALVSITWRHFTRTEQVYKEICKRCYLKQSKRKTLNVSRFGSFRAMLEKRPRVRTGRGIYVLKYSKIRKVQRDMWTEVPVGAILETIYYRYLSFQENDGVVFYALTAKPPYEMIPGFLAVQARSKHNGGQDNLNSNSTKNGIVQGTYQVSGKTVRVNASHPWHNVQMEMNLLENCEGYKGKFSVLQLVKHLSSESGNFDEYWSPDLVEYKVPVENFHFLRDARL